MSYERLTDKNWRRRAYQFDETYKRLAGLEDKIENGLLVEKYYIQEEKFPDGKVMFNVAEYDTCVYMLVSQHSTKAEAEEKLRELKGEE